MGGRTPAERLVQGTLPVHRPDGRVVDLSGTSFRGLYVSDMIAHNNDRKRDVFQLAPCTGRASLDLAVRAHAAEA